MVEGYAISDAYQGALYRGERRLMDQDGQDCVDGRILLGCKNERLPGI